MLPSYNNQVFQVRYNFVFWFRFGFLHVSDQILRLCVIIELCIFYVHNRDNYLIISLHKSNETLIIQQLNQLEDWLRENRSKIYLFPLTILGYLLLFLVMMVSNMLAVIRWPIAAIKRRFNGGVNHIQYKDIISENAVNEINPKELEQILQNHDLVLVDFWAEWCGPCIMMNKPLKKLAESEDVHCIIVKINTMKHKEAAERYNVKGLPTLLLLNNNNELKRYAGALSYKELKEFVNS